MPIEIFIRRIIQKYNPYIMAKGITYFRLQSPYDGDITKNAGLLGTEIDNNFLTLEGRDIRSVYVNGDELHIELLNGTVIRTEDAFKNFAKDLDVKFDAARGELHVIYNGTDKVIKGFTTELNQNPAVATNGSLIGTGKPERPLGISPVAMTGSYRPVKKFIDLAAGNVLPEPKSLKPGDRFLTSALVSDYGFLYDYTGVRNIASDLVKTNSPWRIPTKEDWDNMLNAIEPVECDRNHGDMQANVFLGRMAGKFLKSKGMWKNATPDDEPIDPGFSQPPFPPHHHHHFDGCQTAPGCGEYYCGEDKVSCIDYSDDCCDKQEELDPGFGIPPFHDECCHHHHHHHPFPPVKPFSPEGVDKFGMRITPAGYGDDGHHMTYFGERAYFWTSTNIKCTTAFAKRFSFNEGKVYQDIVPNSYLLSLRLVKDYDGANYRERENILGQLTDTVILPSQKTGAAIWTAENVALSSRYYHPFEPNNGVGLTQTKRYFINEWTGKKWLSNEVVEGEKVVIEDAPNNETLVEYIVKGQELVATNSLIIDQVGKEIGQSIKDLAHDLERFDQAARDRENTIVQNANQALTGAIQAEREARENTDHKLLEYINTNKDSIHTLNDADKELDTRVKALEEATGSGVEFEALKDKVKANSTSLDALDVQVQVIKKQAQTAADQALTASEAVNKAVPDIQNAVKVSEDATKALNDATTALKALQTSVDTNTKAIADLTTRLTALETTVADLKKQADATDAEVAKKLDTTVTTEQSVAGPVDFKMGAGSSMKTEDQF